MTRLCLSLHALLWLETHPLLPDLFTDQSSPCCEYTSQGKGVGVQIENLQILHS